MQKIDTTLSAVVTHKPGKGRIKVLTHITIKAGPLVIASADFGGSYTIRQALAEYRKNPKRFKRNELAAVAA